MDPNRFDSFAKKLGSRLSRRDMMRTSAGVAVGAITVSKFASVAAQDAGTTAKDRFIAVRTYTYTGTEQAAATGLTGLIPVMEQQAGFISYNLVFGDGQILAISTFLDETTAVAAAQQENAWITANAATILTGTPTVQSGDVFLRSELYAGCGCITGTENSCNSQRLTCCATSSNMGGPGICLTNETTCPGAMPAEPTATPAPAQPTAVPACTGEGCDCNGGVQDNCDDGLVCCAADMTDPGSPGTCMDSCDSNDCDGQEGCPCDSGDQNPCNDGLECCGGDEPGGQGTCASSC